MLKRQSLKAELCTYNNAPHPLPAAFDWNSEQEEQKQEQRQQKEDDGGC
jgi:hypothetical protein